MLTALLDSYFKIFKILWHMSPEFHVLKIRNQHTAESYKEIICICVYIIFNTNINNNMVLSGSIISIIIITWLRVVQ